jgi:hypothetical protein
VDITYNVGYSPMYAAAKTDKPSGALLLNQLGDDVRKFLVEDEPIEEIFGFSPAVADILQDMRSFHDTTALSTSEHEYCLYSITQLAAYYLQRHTIQTSQNTSSRTLLSNWQS